MGATLAHPCLTPIVEKHLREHFPDLSPGRDPNRHRVMGLQLKVICLSERKLLANDSLTAGVGLLLSFLLTTILSGSVIGLLA